MRFATRVVHAGLPSRATPGPFLPGPVFAAPYVAPGDPAGLAFTYGRMGNPTWTAWEEALTQLEGGPAVAFASGMAATTAVLAVALDPGDVVVMPEDAYYTTRELAGSWFTQRGVRVALAPTRGDAQIRLVHGAKLVWLESPSNPQLDVCDIARIAAAAHAAGALVAVDNTTATVALQRPLELGADFSLASDTKMLTGHADLLLGHVAVRDPAWHERLLGWRRQTGAIPGPMEVWLAHRSLATLALRVERQSASTARVAEFLAGRSGVTGVRYPGLASHPGHQIAARQMRAAGPVVSFEVAGQAAAERMLGALCLVREATSFGGIHSSAERRARWGGDAVPAGFIRLSVGCEDVEDLIDDLDRALG